jgi:two-component system OmpR family sensor kinase
MGRLFWKFFFFFWLAQFITSLGVGIAIWSLRPEHPFPPPPPPPFPSQPHAPFGAGDPEPRPPPFIEGGPHRPPPPPKGLRFLPPPMPLIAGSLVSLLFAWLLAWYFSRPIRSLRTALDAVADGKLETRVAEAMGRRHDELADLGQDFDRMAERLQHLVESQRRLLHDVSHELRSPLARLQAAAGLMRQQPERGAELVERIERDAARMDRLVGELLTLARLDAGANLDLSGEVALDELIGELVEDVRFEAEAVSCSVALDVSGPLLVRGNGELLHRALENVLRNAVSHSPVGGHVLIAAHEDASGRCVNITVSDDGPGVPADALQQIFQPFFRSDAKTAFAGYGLGLAITRGVIEKHGGSVAAANRLAGGLEVKLLLLVDNK